MNGSGSIRVASEIVAFSHRGNCARGSSKVIVTSFRARASRASPRARAF
jgi:hypothetical protein